MGGNILCRQPVAAVPYYIESVQLNIYSTEELCWLLLHEPELADETVLNKNLAKWLEEECRLPNIGRELAPIVAVRGREEAALTFLFRKCGYFYGPSEKKAIESIGRFFGMSEHDRLKRKGDSLVRHKMYESAIETYGNVLEIVGKNKYMSEFRADVYYNLGCANAGLFRMSTASGCFRKAYELNPIPEIRKGYLCAVYLEKGRDGFRKEADECGMPGEEASKMLLEFATIDVPELPADINAQIDRWVAEYHECN